MTNVPHARKRGARPAWLALAVLMVFAAQAPGQDFLDPFPLPLPQTQPAGALAHFSARPVVAHTVIRPGETNAVAVEMTIAEPFWIYGPVPGGKKVPALPTTIAAGPTPLLVGTARWGPTTVHEADVAGTRERFNVYAGRTVAFVPVTAPPALPPGAYPLTLTIEGQVCDPNICLPLRTVVQAVITIGDRTEVAPQWTRELEQQSLAARAADEWRAAIAAAAATQPTGLPVAAGAPMPPGMDLSLAGGLLLALVAGVILNIMPCVLPVIPLKVLSILQQARQSRRRSATLGLAFSGGIVFFFVALATANIILRLVGHYTFQWGDHFKSPAFIIGMVLLMVLLAANLFGLFTVRPPRRAEEIEPREGHWGAAAMGFVTAILATPCSIAILAAAFAWAQAQPLWLGTVGIVLIGVGMAAPYALLTLFPSLLARIPPAGRWTELFRQSMGFLLLLVAAWLLSVLMPDKRAAWVAAYGVVLAFCLWMWGCWVGLDTSTWRRRLVRLTAAALAVGAGIWMLAPPRPIVTEFVPFDAARIASARVEGRIVLIDFTADWCLTCKAVEALVYDDPAVAQALRAANVLAVRGDVTTRRLPANELLRQLGEPGVPVTVIFPPGRHEPIRLRGLFTKSDLLRALEQAKGSTIDH